MFALSFRTSWCNLRVAFVLSPRVLSMPVLLVERERWLRRRRVPDYRPQRLHPHGHVHLLLRQHAHQGHLVEEVPDAHAGSFISCSGCVSYMPMGFGLVESVERAVSTVHSSRGVRLVDSEPNACCDRHEALEGDKHSASSIHGPCILSISTFWCEVFLFLAD